MIGLAVLITVNIAALWMMFLQNRQPEPPATPVLEVVSITPSGAMLPADRRW